MSPHTRFDMASQLDRVSSLSVFLRGFLKGIEKYDDHPKALDVGCGVGLFSETLLDAGFDVSAVDARTENISEAKRRFSGVEFRVLDVERDSLTTMGTYDVVVCFGLLYHLENPFRVLRDLCEITDGLLVIESMIAPGVAPSAFLVNEPSGENRALRGVAFVPTENCLIKMCYQAGFKMVYGLRRAPKSSGFRSTLVRRKKRTILVATKFTHTDPNLVLLSEPWTTRRDLSLRLPEQVRRTIKFVLGQSIFRPIIGPDDKG